MTLLSSHPVPGSGAPFGHLCEDHRNFHNFMKLNYLILLSILQLINSQYICSPEDPTDCYPQVFEPTNDWKIIKEGQDIPAGLHVRLNIDTLQKEAKLMEGETGNHDIVIVPQPEEDKSSSTPQKNERKAKVNVEEVNDFNSAVNTLLQPTDPERLDQALEVLIEMSHDIEFGIRLTEQDTFTSINRLANSGEPVQEKAYRIIGSALRNNPEAIDNVVKLENNDMVQDWISKLNSGSDLIKKRILGIFQQLVTNTQFKYTYFNGENNLLDKLVLSYTSLGSDSKTRLINIFEDLHLIKEGGESNDNQLSTYVQDKLMKSDFHDEDQYKMYYNILVDLHEKNSDLKPSKEFVAWLDEESGKRNQGIRPRDELYSGSDSNFDKRMLETRNTVFGNPNAGRRHFDDEL